MPSCWKCGFEITNGENEQNLGICDWCFERKQEYEKRIKQLRQSLKEKVKSDAQVCMYPLQKKVCNR
jgi:hypothetical protein